MSKFKAGQVWERPKVGYAQSPNPVMRRYRIIAVNGDSLDIKVDGWYKTIKASWLKKATLVKETVNNG